MEKKDEKKNSNFIIGINDYLYGTACSMQWSAGYKWNIFFG